MKFSVGSAPLASAVSYAVKVTPSRPAQPVHAGVRITATEGFLTILGMDPVTGMNAQATIAAEVSEPGEVLLQGKMLSAVTANVKGDVEMSLEGTRVLVRAGKAKFALPLMPLEEYPAPMAEAGVPAGTVLAADLLQAVERVSIAIDHDNATPMLACMRVEFGEDRITFAGTDRYRLATISIPWTRASKKLPTLGLSIPVKVLVDSVRGLSKDGTELTVSFIENDRLVLSGEARTAKLTSQDADYVAWRRLLPDSKVGAVVFDGKETLETLNRVAIVGEKADPVFVTFAEELAKFKVGHPEGSGAEDEVSVALRGEPEMTVAFNPHYLRDGFAACAGAKVEMSLTTVTKPVVLTAMDNSDFLYLLVPVRAGVTA